MLLTRFSWFIAILLGLGILPSFTALSWSLTKDFPGLSQLLGPLNLLKIYAPFFIFYIWLQRKKIPSLTKKLLWTSLFLSLIGMLLALIPCGFLPGELRDWLVMVLGCTAALAFVLLPRRAMICVLICWGSLLYLSILLDVFFPSAIDWLYENVFDPQTPVTDFILTQRRSLSGVFSRQSLAKFLSWMPWLFLAFSFRFKAPGWVKLAMGVLLVASTGTILSTSQRAPMLASGVGWIIFSLHQSIRMKEHAIAIYGCVALALSFLVTVTVVPTDLIKERFAFIESVRKGAQFDDNIIFRQRITRVVLKEIATHPLGNACISKDAYRKEWVSVAHSHNLFLQQLVSRGWVWGVFHIFLWGFAWLGAWRHRSSYASALAGGLTSVILGGMTDHPWFPLNHSMLLGTFLLLGWALWEWDSRKHRFKSVASIP